jgi:leucyl-tRNA synthetase
MSKSKGNVIVPEEVSEKYGVDVVRMYLMFMGPFDSTMAWNEKTLMGVKRFLDRFSNYIQTQIEQSEKNTVSSSEVEVLINRLINKVTEDTSNFKYNTAIAKIMETLNSLSSSSSYKVTREDIKVLIKLLAPYAPYIAEEVWSKVREKEDTPSVHKAKWPEVNPKYLVEEKVKVAVAVNGKVRDEIELENDK